MTYDKKAISTLKKYGLPYESQLPGKPSREELEHGIRAGVLVPLEVMTHDGIVSEIKALAERIRLEDTAKAFLYSLSTGDTRYRSALSSLIWAKALPVHSFERVNEESNYHMSFRYKDSCRICGCSHGLENPEETDFNRYGVFRFLAPPQYGNQPDFGCAEYVLNDLREFEKLPPVEPCEKDYEILNRIFGAVRELKSHNRASALVSVIRSQKLLDASGNSIHCLLGVLSMCGILETETEKGYLTAFTNNEDRRLYDGNSLFFPLDAWRGKHGVNYDAVREEFGSFSGDRLDPEKAVSAGTDFEEIRMRTEKRNEKAKKSFTEEGYCITLDDRYRHYYGLFPILDQWEKEVRYDAAYGGEVRKKLTLFFDGDTIKKFIYEEYYDKYQQKTYEECDLDAPTDRRILLLPKTSKGRPKPITPSLLMTPTYMCGHLYVSLTAANTLKNHSQIFSFNCSNDQELPLPKGNFVTEDDFIDYTEKYIASCPESYEAVLETFRTKKRTYAHILPGDIFRVQLTPSLYTYCLILGKVREFLEWPEMPKRHPLYSIMSQPIVFRQYAVITDNPYMTPEELKEYPLMVPDYAQDSEVYFGTYPITAHKELEVTDVDFGIDLFYRSGRGPLGVSFNIYGGNEYIAWGLSTHELKEAERHLIEKWDSWLKHYSEHEYYFSFDCGMAVRVWEKELKKGRIPVDDMLSYYEEGKKIAAEALALNPDNPEDDFAEKNGGITREQYIRLAKERCR